MSDPVALCEPFEFGDDPTALYYLYGDTGLLYVGITLAPVTRMLAHAREESWWPEVTRKTMTWYSTREEAAEAEETTARAEKPKYNRTFRRNKDTTERRRRPPRRNSDAYDAAYEAGKVVEVSPGHYRIKLTPANRTALMMSSLGK